MKTNNLVQKIWSFCDTLRDDGLGYNDYLEQLTYLLFLKMADENRDKYNLPDICKWKQIVISTGGELLDQYEKILKTLAESGGMLQKIFSGAQNKIHDSVKLQRLIKLIDNENWSSTGLDIKGEIYESLLQKNAENSGAGQYFTPRSVIQVIIDCVKPKPNETIADPSCGTGGFFLGALEYLNRNSLTTSQIEFLKFNTFHGWEIEKSTARLCLMNLYLHGIGDLKKTPDIQVTDSLKVTDFNHVDIVLANPPFGKSSSDIPTNDKKLVEKKEGYFLREDFWITTGNKQLAFVQHIFNMLKENGRAAVVLPDNVLFEGGAGEVIRRELLNRVNLHTILRLPKGIFYAQGVNANVLFFDKQPLTIEENRYLWYYDYRTNIHHTPKMNPLTADNLKEFVQFFNKKKRLESWSTDNPQGRWRKFSYRDILKRDKVNFDITWLQSDATFDLDDKREPEMLLTDIIDNLKVVLNNLKNVKASI